MLIALDAMGFHAALDDGTLDDLSRERLRDNLMGLALVSAGQPFIQGDLMVAQEADPEQPAGAMLGIALTPAPHTLLANGWLHLQAVQGMVLGEAHISFDGGAAALINHAVHPLPPGTLPDPTLAGTVGYLHRGRSPPLRAALNGYQPLLTLSGSRPTARR